MSHNFSAGEILTAANLNSALDVADDLNTQINPETVNLADDESAYIEFDATARGAVVISANLSTGGHALASFRCGDANAFVTVIAGTAAVAATTGALVGTTGSDGNFTISAHTTLNRLYIENRTGAARTYGFCFASVVGAALVDGTWTVV